MPHEDARYEIKATLPGTAGPQVQAWLRLHPAGFHPAYPPRRVNNVYFDSHGLASVHENLAGIARRVKLRLRWYGTDAVILEGVLELKHKQGLAGWKQHHRIPVTMDLTTMSWAEILKALRRDVPAAFARALDVAYRPVMMNRYDREYFIANDRTVRVTVDTAQSTYSQWAASRPNLTFAVEPHDLIVLEAKAGMRDRDRLSDLMAAFPVSAAKHSKYVTGVHALRL